MQFGQLRTRPLMFDPLVDVADRRCEGTQELVGILQRGIQVATKLITASREKVVEQRISGAAPGSECLVELGRVEVGGLNALCDCRRDGSTDELAHTGRPPHVTAETIPVRLEAVIAVAEESAVGRVFGGKGCLDRRSASASIKSAVYLSERRRTQRSCENAIETATISPSGSVAPFPQATTVSSSATSRRSANEPSMFAA